MTRPSEKQKAALSRVLSFNRIPCCPIIGKCNAKLIGASVRAFLTDPQTMIKAQMAAYERYSPDILVVKGDPLMEVAAMGNKIRFPEDASPYSTKNALEDKGRLIHLSVPDPTREEGLRGFVEAVGEISRLVTDSEILSFITGPWTMALELRGIERLIGDIRNDPPFFHELMGLTTRVSIRLGEALLPFSWLICISECCASSSFISAELYRRCIYPYHKQVIGQLKLKTSDVGIHICGYADPILEDLVATGAAFLSIDAPTDLAKAAEVARDRSVLMGNIHANLFSFGTRQDLKRAVKDCLRIMERNNASILASGCEIPGSAAPERIGWLSELLEDLTGGAKKEGRN